MEPTYNKAAIRAIIGLGNPGRQYHRNRHNIGFRVLDAVADQAGASWREVNNMLVASIRPEGALHEVHLIKPQTFMNSSGQVLSWLTKKGIKPEEILVVHDELEKKFSQLVLKFGGSHKGHNGLKSIIGVIGLLFWRLKVGVDRPEDRNEVPNYVLADFPPEQEQELPALLARAITLII